MLLGDIVKPECVLCNVRATSKKHCLEILSELLVRSTAELANEEVFDGLIERERLGCTSLEQGVAFPHCRIAGLKSSIGALISLTEGVEFDAPDSEAVDLVFGLMVPSEIDEHLQNEIGAIADRLRDPKLRVALRSAATSAELYESLIAGDPQDVDRNQVAARSG